MAGHALDDKSLRRIGDATRKSELARTTREPHTPAAPTNQAHAARFRLLTPLELGRQAVGRMLRLERNDDGTCDWLATDRQELLHAAAGHQLRWDKGAEVTALWTPAGYSVISNALMAFNGTGRDLVPYGVYSVRHSSSNAPGSIVLATIPNFDGEFLPAWDRDYAFVGDVPDGVPLFSDGLDPGLPKLWPCVTDAHTPTWVAYGTDVGAVPPKILDAFGWADGAHPQKGELWAPGSDGRLHRSITTLDLWWWQYVPPEPICAPNYRYNPGAPTFSPGPAYLLGRLPDFNYFDGFWELSFNCPGNWAGSPFCCEPTATEGELEPPNSDEEPPPILTTPRHWIAPMGYWGWGFNGWGGLWGPFNAPAWHGLGLWGAWGYGWWNTRWGGRPPTPVDLEYEGEIPQPNSGRIDRLCRYAWVVWQWGYRVLDVDTDRKLALIIGPIRFSSRLVIDTPDWSDCSESPPTTPPPPTTAPPTTAPPTTPPPTTAPPTTAPPTTAPPTTAPPTTAPPTTAPPTTAPPTTPPPTTAPPGPMVACCHWNGSACVCSNLSTTQCGTLGGDTPPFVFGENTCANAEGSYECSGLPGNCTWQ